MMASYSLILSLCPKLMLYLTLSTLLVSWQCQGSEEAVVSIADLGEVRGELFVTAQRARVISAYKGLPYAEPPIGQLRFARPKAWSHKWEGVRNATDYGPACMQAADFMGVQTIKGSEDCLYLNVYVPPVHSKDELLPVMVYIHGGGFTIGESSDAQHGPYRILERDVIVVTFNYRLGPLGFFTLNSDEAEGNQGLWDQLEALRWVKRNIRSFGGDPNRVTIFGNSAGGASVSALLVNRAVAEEKLIQGAIPQSGSLHMPFAALDNRGSVLPYHQEYAHHLGCQSSDEKEIIECLRQLPASEIIAGSRYFDGKCNFMPANIPYLNPWSPSTDHTFSSQPFFESDRRMLMKSGKVIDVPIMTGFTKEDGLIIPATVYNKPSLFDIWEENWDACSLSQYLGTEARKDEESVDPEEMELAKLVEDFYYGSQVELPPPTVKEEPFFSAYTDIITDVHFAYGAHVMVKGILSNETRESPVFYYRLDHLASFSGADLFGLNALQEALLVARKALGIHSSNRLGVCHGDEIFHLFTQDLPIKVFTDARDVRMQLFIVDLWVNFAIYGTPTPAVIPPDVLSVAWKAKRKPEWPEVEKDNIKFARLESSEINVDIEDTDDRAYQRLAFLEEELVPNVPHLQ